MKHLRLPLATILTSLRLRKVLLASLAIAAATVLYTYQLGGYINLSPIEATVATNNSLLRNIAADPVNLPYKISDWVALHLPFGSFEARARLASVAIALACGGVFYWLVRRWYGSRNAILSTLLFLASGWMLQTGRYGTGLVMLSLMVLALIAVASLVSNGRPHGRTLLLYSAVCAAAMFVPGGLWFVLATTLVIRPKLAGHIKAARRFHLILASALTATASIILMAGLIIRSGQALAWIGLPMQFPEALILAKQAIGGLSYLIVRGPFLPEFWLAHTPVLDVASTGLLLLGILFYFKNRSNARVQLLAAFAGISVLMIALNGAHALSYMVPVAYLTIASGLAYLSQRWFSVFPHNPFAGSLAYIAIGIMLISVGNYHAQRYFIAWRNSPDTLQTYQRPGNVDSHRAPDQISNLIQ